MKLTISVCLLILWCSMTRASIPTWEFLPQCLRKTGLQLNRDLDLFDKCEKVRDELQENGFQDYFDALDETKYTLGVIKEMLENPTRDYLMGYTGATGKKGPAGITGLTGVTGSTGRTGPQGFPGMRGEKGERGPRGPIGPPGDVVQGK